jgi:hypothetical protein
MKQPNFLIIGAQKAGTTSLREFLGSLPSKIFMLKSEQHFWNREGQFNDGYGLSKYQDLFAGSHESQLRGEKSPNYLASFEAPARISRHIPEMKLIAILRNPADRAYSAYWHGRRVGALDQDFSFSQSIQMHKENHGKPYGDLLTPGLYSQHLKRYLEFFPRNQLLILDFEKLLTSPEEELTKALSFLGFENEEIRKLEGLQFPRRNTARVSRFPKLSSRVHKSRLLSYEQKSKIVKKFLRHDELPAMSEKDRTFLAEFYAHEAERIEELTGIRFKWSD